MIELQVLGKTELRTDDAAAANELLAQPRPMALLIYLACANPGAFYRRDALVTLFWPETDQLHARNNLRKLLYTLRQSLGDHAVLNRGDEEVGLEQDGFSCDLVRFHSAFDDGRLAQALELLGRTQPSDWIAVTGGSNLEDWAHGERLRIGDEAAAAAWSLALTSEQEDHLTDAGRWARRAHEFAPEDERKLRRVMELMERIGDRSGALRLYERFRLRLESEFPGTRPAQQTRDLFDRMRNS